MRALFIAFAGTFAVALFAAPAQAQFYFGHSGGHSSHSRYHDDLDHRAYHRELDHREAHRHPMSHRQHDRLHDDLDHDAYHDRLEHRSVHRYRSYSPGHYYGPVYGGHSYHSGHSHYGGHSSYRPGGTSFYLARPGFSIRIGH